MKTDILMLIKTSELRFDDRLLKEIRSLFRLNKSIEVRAIQQKNAKSKGLLMDNIPFKTYRILSREILPHKKLLAIKAFEMYFYFIISILKIRPKVVWIHNIEMIGLVSVLKLFKKLKIVNRIVWDQHELPPEQFFDNEKLKKRLFNAYLNTDFVIQANEARLNHVNKYFTINKSLIIANYPDNNFINKKKLDLKNKYADWLNSRPYFITTGLENQKLRYVENICHSIMKVDNYCLIVMGPYSENTILSLEKKYGENFHERILFTGMVTHDTIVNLTDHAFASIVIYNDANLNSKFCAPNRLYQAIIRGIPVITGNNPTMKEIVGHYKIGYVIDSDGKNVEHIISGINDVALNRVKYIQNIYTTKDKFNWENNRLSFEEILNDI